MKKSTLALSALTLALAASLSACGGGKSSHTVGGTVTGLQYGPLVLMTNGMEIPVQPRKDENGNFIDVTYTFPNQLEYGEAYNVTMKQTGTDADGNPVFLQPPHQYCKPSGGTSDSAGRLTSINAEFVCGLVSNTIGGTISGAAEGLVLTNGSTGGTHTVKKDETTFTFEAPVIYGQTYGVTILTQPTGQTCTVTNGTGVMGDLPIASIAVNCVPNQPT